ncbi:MAG: sterol desaturase family protein [Patescibacteria group bacterium]|nr:sterol desaturase family protein [Patescibacteria group bacterium]
MIILIIIMSVTYVSLFEYILHCWLMHRPVGALTYPFRAHALTHHRIFKADETYHLKDEKDKRTIPMAWWNILVLLPILAIIPAIAALASGDWWMLIIPLIVGALYYGTYEYIHWCMHLPRPRKRLMKRAWIVGWIFYRLNGHHLLHHRYMGKNFNVVFPLWDALLGTLRLRSKIRFAQARGPCVPDVQPRSS